MSVMSATESFSHVKAAPATEVSAALEDWNTRFSKKIKRTKSPKATLVTANSIATQAFDSLKQRHGHLWVATSENKVRAVLIADDKKDEIVIRFLVGDVLESKAKGAGTFLVNQMVELAKKTGLGLRTTPENATKYWKGQGFQQDLKEPTQYIYKPTK